MTKQLAHLAVDGRLDDIHTPDTWRSLEELAGNDDLDRWLKAEFPSVHFQSLNAVSRRRFLQASAASLVLAGVIGCDAQPAEDIVPAIRGESGFVPARPEYFATTLSAGPNTLGVLVENHMGRPTKIEGNPDHPASLGATDAMTQAEILTLYDPARSQTVYKGDRISTWDRFCGALRHRMDEARSRNGQGLGILTSALPSPTAEAQISELLANMPNAQWCVHEPVDDDNGTKGTQIAFGRTARPVYDLSNADVVLACDCDFLFSESGSIQQARQFAKRRQLWHTKHQKPVTRLYVAEPCPTITGSRADHRLPIRADTVLSLLVCMAQRLNALPVEISSASLPVLDRSQRRWCDAVANDLVTHPGRAVVRVGRSQPGAAHAVAWAINEKLNAIGATVKFFETPDRPATVSLAETTRDMQNGRIDTLLLLDVNPVYTSPVDLDFSNALENVAFTAHLGLYRDETARRCDWHVPMAHALESWSDARTQDNVHSLIQPLIRPLYQGKTVHEVLAVAGDKNVDDPQLIVRNHWEKHYGRRDGFETWWRRTLQTGVVSSDPVRGDKLAVQKESVINAVQETPTINAGVSAADALEVRFALDNSLWDGRFATNGWMQELPDPMTKLCWGNAALISPSTAERLNLANEQVLEFKIDQDYLRAPIWILPGHADDSVTLPLGYGRNMPNTLAHAVGFNAFKLRTSAGLWFRRGVNVKPTEARCRLVCTQHHHAMEGRDLVRVVTPAAIRNGNTPHKEHGFTKSLSLYPERPRGGPQWGMVIDLASCIGCSACTIACQAENNIPVVGAQEVSRGREMHWIRIDRYFEGSPDNPQVYHQPVPCMHCENAPCEVVCPVAATSHSTDGLNEMTYNRCVGTRYCSNNCPYKVRRFNFLEYTDTETETLKLQRNPEVTVRSRGVMEKCTYCVQRIRAGDINARKKGNDIEDGKILTACQQVCPTQAIVFGNINDDDSRVASMRELPHHYGLLTHLNTRPRTTYLASISNTNENMG